MQMVFQLCGSPRVHVRIQWRIFPRRFPRHDVFLFSKLRAVKQVIFVFDEEKLEGIQIYTLPYIL
jgi:hypothetical protein